MAMRPTYIGDLDLLETPAPHSIEAEQQVLGCVLLKGENIVRVADTLQPMHFYSTSHQHIYSACLSLFQLGEAISVISVSEVLKDRGQIEEVGGRSYVNDLALSVISDESLEYVSNLIVDKYFRREVLNAAVRIMEAAHQETGREVLQLAHSEFARISEGTVEKDQEVPMADVIKSLMERGLDQREERGIPTGFPKLDNIFHGFKPKNFVILAARPSMGKTALALNFISNAALGGKRVLFFSLEMSKEEIGARIAWAVANGRASDWPEAHARINRSAFLICEPPSLSLVDVKVRARRMAQKYGGVDIIAIDYLQLMEQDRKRGESTNDTVSKLSRGLKAISREFNTCVLALSQLSRGVESRQEKKPQLSDLRDSGALEQDADVVMFIYRDEYYNKHSERAGTADIIVAKQRNGAVGETSLIFRPQISKFYDRSQ